MDVRWVFCQFSEYDKNCCNFNLWSRNFRSFLAEGGGHGVSKNVIFFQNRILSFFHASFYLSKWPKAFFQKKGKRRETKSQFNSCSRERVKGDDREASRVPFLSSSHSLSLSLSLSHKSLGKSYHFHR